MVPQCTHSYVFMCVLSLSITGYIPMCRTLLICYVSEDLRLETYCIGLQAEIASTGYEHSTKMDRRATDREHYHTFGGSQKRVCSALIENNLFPALLH